jgi:S-DNA-T family DNA segregation ATPase FtsK/SpoIIIE
LRRELIGLLFVLGSLLSAWSLGRGRQDGPVVAWWGDLLSDLFGWVALLVPIFLALAAIRTFRVTAEPVILPRHLLGSAVYTLAAAGLLRLGAEQSAEGLAGALGRSIETVAERTLGAFASGLVLTAAGCLAVFLLADLDVRTFESEVRALWPRRQTPDLPAVSVQSPLPEPPAPPTPPRGLIAAEPIINLPVREKAEKASNANLVTLPAPRPGRPMTLPDLTKLALYDGAVPDKNDLSARARRIEETLANFRVEAKVREINPGPTVTQFALEPGVGVPVRRIVALEKDLALAMAAPSIRIEAPVPGLARLGIEIPNAQFSVVGLREVLESAAFGRGKAKLPIPLGRDVNGRYVVGDLTKMPHLLIAGQTGAGKSIFLNAVIATFLMTRLPDDLKLVMIDPKMVELTGYNGVPHLQCPVVTEMDKVVGALKLTLREMTRRYDLFAKSSVRNLDGYREKREVDPSIGEHLPYIVVIIDELADLMMTASEEVEGLLVRLTQMARATGIHLVIATQRPSVNVITGLIKANVPSRIAFAVASGIDSRVVLDMPGAEQLLGRGDMLYLPPDAAKPQRIQGAFVEDKDVHYVVGHWHAIAPVPQYEKEWLELPSSGLADEPEGGGEDPLMEQALEIVRQQGSASASMLQRRLRIGYNRAARLIERMEEDGLIGPADGLRGRAVYLSDDPTGTG